MERRTYSASFMADAVQLVQEGTSISRVARELGIPNGTLWNWVQKARGERDSRTATSSLSAEQQELRCLRQRVAELEQENDFLGKASAYFASRRRT
jgi:transposase